MPDQIQEPGHMTNTSTDNNNITPDRPALLPSEDREYLCKKLASLNLKSIQKHFNVVFDRLKK